MLAVTDLHAYRGPAHVLRGVTLTVPERSIVCLVGRNGAGKTTTLDGIMGILPAQRGTVTFKGRPITRLGPHERARLGIGYAPEDCGIFTDLTVAENLAIGFWLAGRAARGGAVSGDLITALFPELGRLMPRRGLHLSGGEKKMLAIGRAMAPGPSILLLDEAFEGLAPVVVNRFAEAVRRIKDLGISLLIAESNVMTAARVADILYVIDRGEIIFRGAPRQVFENEEVMRTIRG
jgi:branched-chain amino acid transport system ATP-binding protein